MRRRGFQTVSLTKAAMTKSHSRPEFPDYAEKLFARDLHVVFAVSIHAPCGSDKGNLFPRNLDTFLAISIHAPCESDKGNLFPHNLHV
ncbi:MAG: hypothetical protein IJG51_12205, partial [Synergistaceae bacterium]|nr:hypothetical protein [Synergistaceae bacterium]